MMALISPSASEARSSLQGSVVESEGEVAVVGDVHVAGIISVARDGRVGRMLKRGPVCA